MPATSFPGLLSVVMPAYNEEAAIEAVILDHVAVLSRLQDSIPRWEIVCVDDGSTDGTPLVLERLAQRIPQLRIVRQENLGVAAALACAYREARGSYIFNTGSDGQWPAENLQTMLPAIDRGADLVIGVRPNRREVYGPARQMVSFAFNLLPRILFGVPIEDAGGTKFGRREIFLFDLVSRSPFSEAERIIRAQRSNYRLEFVFIRFVRRTTGKEKGASLRNIATSLRDLVLCFGMRGLGRSRVEERNQRALRRPRNASSHSV
jgi:glycosyltransferase involved in cell wall biosynthesis